ncbi:Cutinase [Mycobacterium marinum]|uniref:alpha/beta hydrolase family protein n=1 Tax=Mycobacterium marinum TaxID=1781 RepID=UPI000E3ED066|nr:alpha/beta hydrolase family protein [Mycobacterium marinum]RFZ03711.1 Cutinase [Mycobacterium marinum]
MSLTVADIDRWDAQAVREVFHAATARAQVSLEVSRQLATLSIFANSGGKTAEAAAHQNAGLRRDLDAHGNEALAVARAADRAADGIVKVQSELAALRKAAAAAELQIDALSNRVVPIPGLRHTESEWARVLAKQAELQADLGAIVVEANTIDEELASAVNMADGDSPIPAEAGAPVGPEGLTPTQRASDANEELLREERAKLRARIGQLQGRYDQLAARAASDYNNGILDSDAMGQLAALDDQLTAAKGRLGDLDAVDQALSRAPETYLAQLRLPDDPHQQVLAAVAVGNPDTAANVSVTVPGVGSTTRGTLPGMVSEARNLRLEEMRQLKNSGKPTSVATIAWMGYEPPPNPLDTASAGDLWQTMTDGQARAGAGDLSRYLQQVRANNPSGHLTVLGHSYGSLTASLALQDLNAHGAHPVNDVVFYGSPGLELYSPAQLGLEHGHAYVMQAPHDLITSVVAPLAPLHGWGPDPYLTPGLTELSSQAGFDPGGIWRDGAYAHGDYPRVFQDAAGQPQLRMSGYNLAAIAAGLPDNKVGAPLLPPVLGGGMPAAPGHVLAGGN